MVLTLLGHFFGKHKMVPEISPKKTWEGFFGGILFSLFVSLGLFTLFSDKLTLFNYKDACVLGVLLSLGAVVGDLVESILKRGFQVKDSGKLLPGIGGVLDLIDSICLLRHLYFIFT